MNPDGKTSSSKPSSRSYRSRHHRRRKKSRKRSLTPTSLQLDGDDVSDNDYDSSDHQEKCRRKRSSPPPWTSDLHRDFVEAVLKVGIEESSPAVIAEQMITKNNYNTPAEQSNDTDTVDKANEIPNHISDNDLPEESRYFKRELTGERLKSHLQKTRKQRVREIEIFLGDHQRFLTRQQKLERATDEFQARERQRKADTRKLRRQNSLLESSAFDHVDEEENPVGIGGSQTIDESTLSDHNHACEEEEERLLSLYLPLRSSGIGGMSIDDFDSDEEFDQSDAFPVGGRAIGMVTWAVQQQEIQDQKKRNRRRQKKNRMQQRAKRHKQSSSSKGVANDESIDLWEASETASVDSWTSHTAITAGKLADIFTSELGHEEDDPWSASSEDEEEDDKEQEDPFRVSIPTLTEAEKNSPLGLSMRLSWDMIKHMHGVISEERVRRLQEQLQQRGARAPHQREARDHHRIRPSAAGAVPHTKAQLPMKIPHLSVEEKVDGSLPEKHGNQSETNASGFEPSIPRNAMAAMSNQAWNSPHANATTMVNSFLLTAIAENGPPPANLVAALGGTVLANLGKTIEHFDDPRLVIPPSQRKQGEGFDTQQQQQSKWQWNHPVNHNSGSAFNPAGTSSAATSNHKSPLPPTNLPPTASFLRPESRPESPSLQTPTTPSEAMFNSPLKQQEQQHEEQQKQKHFV